VAVRVIHPALENYTRDWCGYQVDKNLKDDWLKRLNLLRYFDLLGICEGHFSCDDDVSYIVVRAKEGRFKDLLSRVDMVGKLLEKHADLETRYSVTTMFDFPIGSFVGESSRWLFKISLTRLEARTSLEMDMDTESWFEKAIRNIEMIDRVMEC